MKLLKFLGKCILFLLLAFLSYYYWYSHGEYDTGENGEFKLHVGETAFFKIYSNGSTGYQEFWINDSLASAVELERTEYNIPFWQWGLNGAGGLQTFHFKAIKAGIDTVKIAAGSPAYWHPEGYTYKDTPVVINTFVFKVE